MSIFVNHLPINYQSFLIMSNFDLPTRIQRVRLFYGLMAVGAFLAICFPFIGGDNMFNSSSGIFGGSGSMLMLSFFGYAVMIVSAFVLSGCFEDNDNTKAFRAIGFSFVPIALLYLLFANAMFSIQDAGWYRAPGGICYRIISGLADAMGEYFVVFICAIFMVCLFCAASKFTHLGNNTYIKSNKLTGAGFYTIAVMVTLALIMFILVLSGNVNIFGIFDNYSTLETFLTIMKVVGIISLLCIMIGLIVAIFASYKALDINDVDVYDYTPVYDDASLDVANYGSGTWRQVASTQSVDNSTAPVAAPQCEPVAPEAVPKAEDLKYQPRPIGTATPKSERELLIILQQPGVYSDTERDVAAAELYNRGSQAYIGGFSQMSLEQLQAIVQNPADYLPTDVKAAAEQLRLRYN